MSFNLLGFHFYAPILASFYLFKMVGFTLLEIEYDCEWVSRDLKYQGKAIQFTLCNLHFVLRLEIL